MHTFGMHLLSHDFTRERRIGRTDRQPVSAPSTTATPPAVIIALANQKGGVGKTTTAVNLGVLLARSGLRVLLVDIDPQGNATSSLGIDKSTLSATTYDVLIDRFPANRAAIPTDRPGLSLVASTPMLAGAEVELVGLSERERRLAHALSMVASSFDVVFIDCP